MIMTRDALVQIVPISEKDIDSYRKCVDTIAQERKYLGFVKAPSLESTRETVKSNIYKKNTSLYRKRL